MLLSLERCGAILALLRVGVVWACAVDDVAVVLMVAWLHTGLRTIPAHVVTLCSNSHTLGAHHQYVADAQRAVVVAFAARTEGSPAGLVTSCMGDDGAVLQVEVVGQAGLRQVVRYVGLAVDTERALVVQAATWLASSFQSDSDAIR